VITMATARQVIKKVVVKTDFGIGADDLFADEKPEKDTLQVLRRCSGKNELLSASVRQWNMSTQQFEYLQVGESDSLYSYVSTLEGTFVRQKREGDSTSIESLECCGAAEEFLWKQRAINCVMVESVEEKDKNPFLKYANIEKNTLYVIVEKNKDNESKPFVYASLNPKNSGSFQPVPSDSSLYLDVSSVYGFRKYERELRSTLSFNDGTGVCNSADEYLMEQEKSLEKEEKTAPSNPLLNLGFTDAHKANITQYYGRNMPNLVASMGKLIDRGKEKKMDTQDCEEKFTALVNALKETPSNIVEEKIEEGSLIGISFKAAVELNDVIAKLPEEFKEIKNEMAWFMSRILGAILFAGAAVGITLSAGAALPVTVGVAILAGGLGFFASEPIAHKISPTLADCAETVVSDMEKRTRLERPKRGSSIE
jgi:hypothetical protein